MTSTAAPLPGTRQQRSRRTPIAVLLLLLTGLLAIALASAPFAAAALPVPSVTITPPSPVYVGYPAAMTVTVANPSAAGESVTLERFNGLLWGAVETKALDGSSKTTFTVTPTSTTSVKYRARIPATPTHAAGTSATYTMTPTLKVPDIALTGPAYIVVNKTKSLVGSVSNPTAVNENVTLQKWTGLSWSTSATLALNASSTASFPVTPTAVGNTRYRLTIAKTSTHAAATSAEFVVHAVATAPFDCGGGTQPLKSNGTSWVCTYNDEFNETALDTDYWNESSSAETNNFPGPTYQKSCFMKNSANYTTSRVHDGVLELYALVLPAPVDCGRDNISSRMVSGEVHSYTKYFQTYGRFEVKAKLPDLQTKGLQETFWLWPENQIGDGEIDYAEFYSANPSLNKPVMHYYVDPSSVNLTTHHNEYATIYGCPLTVGAYNTYRLEWVPGNMKFWVNDVLCLQNNYQAWDEPPGSPAPFDRDFFLALSQAFGTDVGGDNVFPLGTGPTTSSTKIEYIRVWK